MTVASVRSQPPPQPAPPAPSFESEAHAALVRIANNFNEHLDEADRDAIDPATGKIELSPALKQRHAEFDASGIDAVVALVDSNVADKKERREQTRKSLVTQGDTAAEIKATRVWEANRNLLDSQGGSLAVGGQLIEQADAADLSTLLEQLPSYYAARGIDATAVIEATVTKRCPELAQADREARRAELNAAVLKAGAAQVRAGIQSGCKIRPESLLDPNQCGHNKS